MAAPVPTPTQRLAASRRIPIMLLACLAAGCTRYNPPAPVIAGHAAHSRPGAVQEPAAHPDSIVVGAGETLYGVSRRYGVPIRSLLDANDLRPPFRLLKGQRLLLPQVRSYMVQPGDTLNAVSRRFGVDVSTLAATNRLSPPYPIHTGEILVLPAPVQSASAAPMAGPPRPPVPTMASPAAARPVVDVASPAIIAEPLKEPVRRAPTKAATGAEPGPVVTASRETGSAATPPAAVAPAPAAPAPAPAAAASPGPEKQTALLTPPSPPQAAPPHTGLGFQWPVRGTILVGYGPGANGTQNDGINIAAARGTPVAAANDGIVAYAGNELRGFGNLVLIKHAGGWTTAYAHCETLLVKRGDRVKRGQTIARVGQSGAVSEPQLHFEIRHGTRALDPVSYLPPVSTAKAE